MAATSRAAWPGRVRSGPAIHRTGTASPEARGWRRTGSLASVPEHSYPAGRTQLPVGGEERLLHWSRLPEGPSGWVQVCLGLTQPWKLRGSLSPSEPG